MAASIFHRATGFVLATAAMLTLVWWLYAIAYGPEAYASFQIWAVSAGEQATGMQNASNWFFRLLALGVIWSFFQHFFSGLRHLLMDMGAGFELVANRKGALAVFIAAIFATAAVVLFIAMRFSGV